MSNSGSNIALANGLKDENRGSEIRNELCFDSNSPGSTRDGFDGSEEQENDVLPLEVINEDERTEELEGGSNYDVVPMEGQSGSLFVRKRFIKLPVCMQR